MLKTSYLLTPILPDSSDCPPESPPAEHLEKVYLCASSPPVIEEWAGWPEAPYVVAGSVSYLIHNCGAPSSGTLADPLKFCAASKVEQYDSKEDSSPMPPSRQHTAIFLDVLRSAYEGADERSGSAFLQVYPVGMHSLLSLEVKSIVVGCAMNSLRSRLSYLLGVLTQKGLCESDVFLDGNVAGVLEKYCRCLAAVTPSSGGASHAGCAADKKLSVAQSQRWVVTWASELVACVAASLIAAGPSLASICPPLCVSDCGESLRTALYFAFRGSSQDTAATHPAATSTPSFARSSSWASSAQRRLRRAALSVQLHTCSLASSHPLDVRHAVDIASFLHSSYVVPAQEHAEDGTEALHLLTKMSDRLCDPLELTRARAVWGKSHQSYQSSAIAAQRCVLFLLRHDVTAQAGPAAVLPLSVREERSRVHVADKSRSPVYLASLYDRVRASAHLRTASSYYIRVLLCQSWSSDDPVTDLYAGHWADKLASTATLAPARASMEWRASLRTSQPKDSGTTASEAPGGQTAEPTPLQWILYTARRQLVVAVANRSQTVLTGRRLGLDSGSALETKCVSQFSLSTLRALADQCVKALFIARGLLGWHCPWPVPACLGSLGAYADVPSVAGVEELLWTLRMLCKLRWRASQLYEAAGDSVEGRRQVQALRDEVQRWSSRRISRARAVDVRFLEPDPAARTASVEDIVCHIDDVTWGSLVKELSSVLPPA